MMTLPCDYLVLFDGVCNFCCASIQFVIKRDRHNVFRFASIQSEIGRQIYSEQGLNPNDLQTLMLATRAGVFLRSDAAIEIARKFGGCWKLMVLFKAVPRFLRDGVYNVIARNRYRWFGRKDSCMIPTPDIRQRFLS